jgi:hypothetical protein
VQRPARVSTEQNKKKEKTAYNIAYAISWFFSKFGEQIFLSAFVLQTNTSS